MSDAKDARDGHRQKSHHSKQYVAGRASTSGCTVASGPRRESTAPASHSSNKRRRRWWLSYSHNRRRPRQALVFCIGVKLHAAAALLCE